MNGSNWTVVSYHLIPSENYSLVADLSSVFFLFYFFSLFTYFFFFFLSPLEKSSDTCSTNEKVKTRKRNKNISKKKELSKKEQRTFSFFFSQDYNQWSIKSMAITLTRNNRLVREIISCRLV